MKKAKELREPRATLEGCHIAHQANLDVSVYGDEVMSVLTVRLEATSWRPNQVELQLLHGNKTRLSEASRSLTLHVEELDAFAQALPVVINELRAAGALPPASDVDVAEGFAAELAAAEVRNAS